MSTRPSIQLREFCEIFDFEDRQVRFVLEQGFLPRGVAERPQTGNRREFRPYHAFWLAIVMYLKTCGVKVSRAAEIADVTSEGLRVLAQNFGWDAGLWPQGGWFETECEHYLEIGDMLGYRLVSNAEPSRPWFKSNWLAVKPRSPVAKDYAPVVLIRLDLSQIAARLRKVEGWGGLPRR